MYRYQPVPPWSALVGCLLVAEVMVLALDGNSEHVAHGGRRIGLFGNRIQIWPALDLKKLPEIDQITKINSHVRTYF